jgi:hypothetical protein
VEPAFRCHSAPFYFAQPRPGEGSVPKRNQAGLPGIPSLCVIPADSHWHPSSRSSCLFQTPHFDKGGKGGFPHRKFPLETQSHGGLIRWHGRKTNNRPWSSSIPIVPAWLWPQKTDRMNGHIAGMLKQSQVPLHVRSYQRNLFLRDGKRGSDQQKNMRRFHLPITYRLANRADAPINRRILSEPCELGRPPWDRRWHGLMALTWVKLVLGPFPERKSSAAVPKPGID